jgi:hypothetical protein
MRVILILFSMLCVASPTLAGGLDDRLGRLEYDSRIQRADIDILARQQTLDAQDARDREVRRRTDDMIEEFRRGSRDVPVKPIELPR